MPRGGARPGAGRPRKNPDALVKPKAAKARVKKTSAPVSPEWPFPNAQNPVLHPVDEKPAAEHPPEGDDDGLTAEQRAGLSPLDYLLAVMRSPNASKSARMTAAIQAAPYVHAKVAPIGKKAAKEDAAKKTTGRFAPKAPPRLVVNNGGG